MKPFLREKSSFLGVSGSAYGKAILIGEHAAVYGYPALAIPLKNVSIHIEILELNLETPRTWDQAWTVYICGKLVNLPPLQRSRLTASLALAVQECRSENLQEHFPPGHILLRSEIPLGAGMGGSAAVSAALVRLVDNISGLTRPNFEVARIANLIDGLFHGNASGLDAATVVATQALEFVRGRGCKNVHNAKEFHLVLLDSQERAHTSDMVNRVATALQQNSRAVNSSFAQLGMLVETAKSALAQGHLQTLGAAFDSAHAILQELGVSTPKLDSLTNLLRKHGALGAKVTGAGGGGLVLGLFETIPLGLESVLFEESGRGAVYKTCVPENLENFHFGTQN